MKRLELICAGLLLISIAAGTVSDASVSKPPLFLRGYRVLTGDFHVHTFPLSSGTLAPWDLAFEARRQGIDVLAITAHNEALSGRAGAWFWRRFGGPILIAGEEIHGPHFHLIAVGIHRTISWRLTPRAAIDEIHRQGGVAIAAHPTLPSWSYWTADAVEQLDGAEVRQPVVYIAPSLSLELEKFFARGAMAAIGSSDYHGFGPLGLCRTLVFVREASPQGVLEAIRAHRTVVIDGEHAWGDPALVPLALQHPELAGPPPLANSTGALVLLSRICGISGLLGLVILVATPDRR
jgi:hypothetical protein